MKRSEAIGIAACFLLAPGYVLLMLSTGSKIEWFVVFFIGGMGILLTLFATVLRKYMEDTDENRTVLKNVIGKAASRSLGKVDE